MTCVQGGRFHGDCSSCRQYCQSMVGLSIGGAVLSLTKSHLPLRMHFNIPLAQFCSAEPWKSMVDSHPCPAVLPSQVMQLQVIASILFQIHLQVEVHHEVAACALSVAKAGVQHLGCA